MTGISTFARSHSLTLVILFSALSQPVQASPPCFAGEPSAPITLEIFSDFECPACQLFYMENVRRLLDDKFADRGLVCVRYREFPLTMHKHAREAARWARAAWHVGADEGRAIVEALYVFQAQWSLDGDIRRALAGVLPPDRLARVEAALDDPKVVADLESDLSEGRQRGVRSTPTIFLISKGREEKIKPPVEYSALRSRMESLLLP